MVAYECKQLLCSNGQKATDALRADFDETVNGVNGILKQLGDSMQSPGKKWVTSSVYDIGDIVSLGQVLYIAKKVNNGKQPSVYRNDWAVFKLPFTQNQGKVKAYCIFKTDGTIIKSMNIRSVLEYTGSTFIFYFTNNVDTHPIVMPGLVESSLDEDLMLSIINVSNIKVHTKIVSVPNDQESITTRLADNDDRIITFICYSSGNVL